MMNNYGFEPYDPDLILKLQKINVPEIPMQGSPWYLPLTNP